jgi:hypothetical protein
MSHYLLEVSRHCVSNPIYSPDGNWVWDGNQWIPVQLSLTSEVQTTEYELSIAEITELQEPLLETQNIEQSLSEPSESAQWQGWINQILLMLVGCSAITLLFVSVAFELSDFPGAIAFYSFTGILVLAGILVLLVIPSVIFPNSNRGLQIIFGMILITATILLHGISVAIARGSFEIEMLLYPAILLAIPFYLYPMYIFSSTLIGYYFLHNLPERSRLIGRYFGEERGQKAWKNGVFIFFTIYGCVSALSTIVQPIERIGTFFALGLSPMLTYMALRNLFSDVSEFVDHQMSKNISLLFLLLFLSSMPTLFISEFWFGPAHEGVSIMLGDGDILYNVYPYSDQLQLASAVNIIGGVMTITAIVAFVYLTYYKDGNEHENFSRLLKNSLTYGVLTFPILIVLSTLIIAPSTNIVIFMGVEDSDDEISLGVEIGNSKEDFNIILALTEENDIENISKKQKIFGFSYFTDYNITIQHTNGSEWLDNSEIDFPTWFDSNISFYNISIHNGGSAGDSSLGILVDLNMKPSRVAVLLVNDSEIIDYGFYFDDSIGEDEEFNAEWIIPTVGVCCVIPVFLLISIVNLRKIRSNESIRISVSTRVE